MGGSHIQATTHCKISAVGLEKELDFFLNSFENSSVSYTLDLMESSLLGGESSSYYRS